MQRYAQHNGSLTLNFQDLAFGWDRTKSGSSLFPDQGKRPRPSEQFSAKNIVGAALKEMKGWYSCVFDESIIEN